MHSINLVVRYLNFMIFFNDIICIFCFFFINEKKKLKKVFNIAFVKNSYVVCIEKINHRRCSVSFISSRLQKWESFFIFSFTRFEMKTKETLKNSIIFSHDAKRPAYKA